MEKKELAQKLRERQLKKNHLSKEVIEALTADQIIKSYVTCSGCGETLTDGELRAAIHIAKSVDDFFAISDGFHLKKHQ